MDPDHHHEGGQGADQFVEEGAIQDREEGLVLGVFLLEGDQISSGEETLFAIHPHSGEGQAQGEGFRGVVPNLEVLEE